MPMMSISAPPSLVVAVMLLAVGCGGRTGLGTAGVSLDAAADSAASTDLSGVDAQVLDSGPVDAWLADTGVADRTAADASIPIDQRVFDASRPPDISTPDVAVGDLTVDRGRDVNVVDAGTRDVLADSAPPDTSVRDTSVRDTSVRDTSVRDTSVRDTSVPDTSVPDTSLPDASQPDVSPPDTSVPDTSSPDAALPDAPQPDAQPYDPVLAVSRSRYLADLTQIAKVRAPQSAQWRWVQSYCAKTFAEAGFQVELHAFSSGGRSGVNVVGTRAGSTRPAEQVIVSAHYDHIAGCAGADDNASGVAGVLEAARVLAAAPHARTLIVACWDLEEAGLLGSQAYATRARQRAQQLTMVYVMEMIGFRATTPGSQTIPNEQLFALLFPQQVAAIRANQYRGDFIAAFGNPATAPALAAIEATAARVGLSAITGAQSAAVLGLTPLARSDHSSFWLQSYPALFITDTAEFRNPNYHCRNGSADTVQTLDIDFAVQTTQAMVGSAHAQLGAP